MSDSYNDQKEEKKFNKNENLESIQDDQDNVGAAESNPSTTGPTENVRKEAAKAVDETESDKDSV